LWGSKPSMMPPIIEGTWVVSKRRMRRMPFSPRHSRSKTSLGRWPIDVTMPRPVTATRRSRKRVKEPSFALQAVEQALEARGHLGLRRGLVGPKRQGEPRLGDHLVFDPRHRRGVHGGLRLTLLGDLHPEQVSGERRPP